MRIFNIPEEVFHHDLFPCLDWNDLLRLRRVSRYFKYLADDFIKSHADLAPEIEINECDKTLDEFVEMGIPTKKLFLKNESGAEFFTEFSWAIAKFLKNSGSEITQLRMDHLSHYMFGEEWDFFDGLERLESLEAMDYGRDANGTFDWAETEALKRQMQDVRRSGQSFPTTFKLLKKLKISVDPQSEGDLANVAFTSSHMLGFCENLENACLPFCSTVSFPAEDLAELPPLQPEVRILGGFMLYLRRNVISERYEDHPEKTNLKVYDFQFNCKKEKHQTLEYLKLEADAAAGLFMSLCQVCLLYGVKLLNVRSLWFKRSNSWDEDEYAGRCVESLINLHPSIVDMDMPNLKRLDVTSTSQCELPDVALCPNWPSLKVLRIVADSQSVNVCAEARHNYRVIATEPTFCLFKFLLTEVVHTSLAELRLLFKPEGEGRVPRLEKDIISSCPNLKKLELVNWVGCNRHLCRLWTGLRGLEEVTLESCKTIGSVAFIGEDIREPAFINLSRLKKLTLKGLDEMPKITDALFRLVLPRMRLTHLFLSSGNPIKSVTTVGIRGLLRGRFAESIEKFPFKGWSLANCSQEEFQSLECKFRSHYMI